jgi:hypothetical protein
MHTEVGIFTSRNTAEQVAHELVSNGIPESSITFLTGENADLEHLSTTDTEPDGMGKAMGAFLGGVAGAGAGAGIGTAAASLMIPGVGPILAAGIGAAALLGVGATAGASLGAASETALDQGPPKDDVFLYHDLLKNRRSLVIVNVDKDEQADKARKVFDARGAEDVSEARSSLKARHDANLRQAS